MSKWKKISQRLDPDLFRRLGAALWFRVGLPVHPRDLYWAVSLLGEGGDLELWEALQEAGVLNAEGKIAPQALARWLSWLSTEKKEEEKIPRLVWTLPNVHPDSEVLGTTYLKAILETIERTQRELLMTSPFMQEQGIIQILKAIIQALQRGVRLILLTHAAENLASLQSAAVDEIRREAERTNGHLIVYTANPEVSFLHAKVILSDEKRLILGSANLTAPGLRANFETGVVLGPEEARQAAHIIRTLILTGTVIKAFSTES